MARSSPKIPLAHRIIDALRLGELTCMDLLEPCGADDAEEMLSELGDLVAKGILQMRRNGPGGRLSWILNDREETTVPEFNPLDVAALALRWHPTEFDPYPWIQIPAFDEDSTWCLCLACGSGAHPDQGYPTKAEADAVIDHSENCLKDVAKDVLSGDWWKGLNR